MSRTASEPEHNLSTRRHTLRGSTNMPWPKLGLLVGAFACATLLPDA